MKDLNEVMNEATRQGDTKAVEALLSAGTDVNDEGKGCPGEEEPGEIVLACTDILGTADTVTSTKRQVPTQK
jgi:hypothetical protein